MTIEYDYNYDYGYEYVHKASLPRFSNLNKFLPFQLSLSTQPLLPIGSMVQLESCFKVSASPWFAMKRWPLPLSRPTI